MGSEKQADCVIVGGGLGGAVLARELASKGFHTVILEREVTQPPTRRPEILSDATLRLLLNLSQDERLRTEASIPLEGIELYQPGGRCLFRVTERDFSRYKIQPYSTDPSKTREILLQAAKSAGADVIRDTQVTGLHRQDGRVAGVFAQTGRESTLWKSSLLVGNDGPGSWVRSASAVGLKARPYPFTFICAVVPQWKAYPDNVGRSWMYRDRRCGLFRVVTRPLPQRRLAVICVVPTDTCQEYREGSKAFYDLVGKISPVGQYLKNTARFPEDFGFYQTSIGHVTRYVEDGMALLGDSSHPVSPVGGQGANMSVWDAVELSKIASHALKDGDCSAKRLREYEIYRRPFNRRALRIPRGINMGFRILHHLPWFEGLSHNVLAAIGRLPITKRFFLHKLFRTHVSPKVPRS